MNRMFFIALAMLALIAGYLPSQVFSPASAADHSQHAGCMTTCHACAEKCKETIAYAKKKGGEYVNPTITNALQDCVTSCNASADYMKRGSSFVAKSCAFCEEVCRKCAEVCDTFKDDKQMKSCADECRKCAESCKEMQKKS